MSSSLNGAESPTESPTRYRRAGAPRKVASSLARDVGPCLSSLVSLLLLAAHLLFCYGQLVGKADDCPGFNNSHGCPPEVVQRANSMMEVDLHARLAYHADGPLAMLTALVEDAACHARCPAGEEGLDPGAPPLCSKVSCDECVEVLGVTSMQHCRAEIEMPVAHMSYLYAVTQLWGQDASPLCQRGDEPTCTHQYPGRPASAVLVVFSFIWPHVKLLLLHLFFYAPLTPLLRRNGNYWLAFFGKWTLADVLVMTCLLGLLNIDASSSLLSLWQEIEPDVAQLCTAVCQPRVGAVGGFDDDFFTSLGTGPIHFSQRMQGYEQSSLPAAQWRGPPMHNSIIAPPGRAILGHYLSLQEERDAGRLSGLGVPGLGQSSPNSLNCSSLCESIASLLGHSVLSPEELPQSDLSVSLRLRGLTCMYFFCIAVVLSLSISVLVDNLDDFHREEAERQQICKACLDVTHEHAGGGAAEEDGTTGQASAHSLAEEQFGPTNSPSTNRSPTDAFGSATLAAALLDINGGRHCRDGEGSPGSSPRANARSAVHRAMASRAMAPRCGHPGDGSSVAERGAYVGSYTMMSTSGKAKLIALCKQGGVEGKVHVLLVLVQIMLTILAFCTPLFERKLTGSLSLLLKHYGFDFTGFYSMLELGLLSAQRGGWALIMSATFWIFIIICPLVRGFTQLYLLLSPMTLARARHLHSVSRAVSYYYAFEVMLVAVPLIGITIQPMTSSLFTDFNTPICKQINEAFPNPPGTDPPNLCFTISVVPSAGYWVVVSAVVVFLASGFDGSPTHKYIHRRLFPRDEPPPNLVACAAQCCRTG